MANLIISSLCNLSCPYCFAGDYYKGRKAETKPIFISPESFEEQLDFLDRSGISEIRLIGGEPSLHPYFPELIQRAQQRRKRIMVFTNGMLPSPALDSLLALSSEECTVLINMNTTGKTGLSEKAQQRRQQVIRQLGPRALLGYNIYSIDFDLRSTLEMSRANNCQEAIRLGLAQPTLSGQNTCLHPKQYPMIGQRIAEYAVLAAELGRVILDFDCGFVRCMFSDEAMDTLRQAKVKPGFHCSAILDIDLDQNVFHCFPLADRFRITMIKTSDAAGLRAELSLQTQAYRWAGIYRECSSCSLKSSGECTGGCLANTVRRFRQADFSIRVPQ